MLAPTGEASPAVRDRFERLLSELRPLASHAERYSGHRQTIERRLVAGLGGGRIQVFGSHARGSAIRSESDLDLLAELPRSSVRYGNRLVSSARVLGQVRDELLARYPATHVKRDGQAVVVNFGGGLLDVDVVPAVFEGMGLVPHLGAKRPIYLIPDGAGGWLATSPQAHGDYIRAADRSAGGKLKYTAWLLKYWSLCRTPRLPLQSFHAELLLAYMGTCGVAKSYAECMAAALRTLSDRACAALRDPLGISGIVPASHTQAKRHRVLAAATSSADHAQRALAAARRGHADEALRQWDIVFNQQFL